MPPQTDPDEPEVPAGPADVPEHSAPTVRSALGTSEAEPPVQGVHAPEGDDPAS